MSDAIHDANVDEIFRTRGTRPDEAVEQPNVTERRAFAAAFEEPDSIEWRYWVEQMPILSAHDAARLMSALEPDAHRNLDALPNESEVNSLRLKALKIERLAAAHGRERDSPAGWLRWARGLGLKVHDGFVLAVEELEAAALVRHADALPHEAAALVATQEAPKATAAEPVAAATAPAQAPTATQAAPAKKQANRRPTWRDAAWPYMVETLRAGQYATGKELDAALTARAGEPDSPFDKGEGPHRGSLFVRAAGRPLALKTIQNNMPRLRDAAKK